MIETPKILIVGSGAREHALGWKFKEDTPTSQLFFAPGNGGTGTIGKNIDKDANDINGITGFSKENEIDIVVIGPERPIAEGLTDALTEEKIKAFGPSMDASFLEADKAKAARFMQKYNIPHPESRIFTDFQIAAEYVRQKSALKIVIKASGLAEGKGVILPSSEEEAEKTLRAMMIDRKFVYGGKNAAEKVLIQERLKGHEVSVIGFVSNDVNLLVPAQDYKRAYDGDRGPNTGGMGAYAPNRHLTREDLEEIYDSILVPTRDGMIDRGTPFKGILYVGVMLTKDGPKVLEYNIRFGDPEAQVQMRLLKSNLYEAMKATMNSKLTPDHVINSHKASVGVVLASEGYPNAYKKDRRIDGLSKVEKGIVVFHAGTRVNPENDQLETSGGRVLTVTSVANTLDEAANKTHRAANIIIFEGKHRRSDIAT